MAKYISIGKFNKKYFFILGSISVRFILIFISGLTPYLTPKQSYYLFGFKSQILSHPLISYCFQYFFIFLGGLILELIFQKKTKNRQNTSSTSEIKSIRNFTVSSKLTHNNGIGTKNDRKYFLRIFLVFSLYYFAKITVTSLDNIGYNRIKYWPLEFIFLIIFAKKILKKNFYKHQKLSLIVLVFCCTSIYIINSFIPQSNKDCSSVPKDELEDCKILSNNIYNDIIEKLTWFFIPILIFIYLLAMIANAYSSISNKWFMDIKYINLYRILIYLGVIGFIYSIILLFIFSNIPCSKENNTIIQICRIEYNDDFFYENYRTLSFIEIDKEFFIDIFVSCPIYIISSFLNIFFELMIIIKLDPFYVIPIESAFFFIVEIIDYCITYSITNICRNIKFVCQLLSNGISMFLCSIYLEIIILHFCGLDLFTRISIIDRLEEENKMAIIDIKEEKEESKGEDNENESEMVYIFK